MAYNKITVCTVFEVFKLHLQCTLKLGGHVEMSLNLYYYFVLFSLTSTFFENTFKKKDFCSFSDMQI